MVIDGVLCCFGWLFWEDGFNREWCVGLDAGGSFFEMVEEGLMGFGLFLQAG